jgi:hypothetical protein
MTGPVSDRPPNVLIAPAATELYDAFHAKSRLRFGRYLTIVAIFWLMTVGLVFELSGDNPKPRPDHLGAVPLSGDYSWYMDFGGRYVSEIEDEDLFYHNIGNSIDDAKKADIILLGPSFVAYALDPELLRQFGKRHGVKIYNMSFIGIRGGEFSREIIKRWRIHPKLWIINVDDQFIHFFSHSLDLSMGSKFQSISVVNYGRLRGWLTASSRNMRWRLEDRWASWWLGASGDTPGIYRRPDDGSIYLGFNPKYIASDNTMIHVDRDQNCHATQSTIDIGRSYLNEIGGNSILMLVPHSQYCPQQAVELAQALHVEAIVPPNAEYTTVDGGGHLDHKGALAFTEFVLSKLERSETFQKALSSSQTKP